MPSHSCKGLAPCRHCLEPHSAPRYSVFTDKEAQQALVHVSFKHGAPPCRTPREYKRALTEDIFQTALNKRFFRISRQRDPPFYVAEVPPYIWASLLVLRASSDCLA